MHKDASAILIITTILIIVGIFVNYSVEGIEKNLQQFLTKQIIILLIGFVAFLFMLFYDYHSLLKPLFLSVFSAVCIILLILVLVVGDKSHGAKRWILLPMNFTFQPSEITKFLVILSITCYLSECYSKLKKVLFGLFLPLIISGFYAGLIFLENDQGIPTVIMVTVLCMMFVAGIRIRQMIVSATALSVVFGIAIFMKPHRIYRIIYTWFPEWDPSGKGWHIIQSLVSFYRGGLFGVGIGAGEQKLNYLPEANKDFPFSLITEEMGMLTALLLVLLFFLFIYYGFEIARKAPDIEGSLLAVGV
ncbi:MAG: FtsW/RodA/SpoVE family cell cycle protein, partial [Candidatus Hydrogenedens sp.]|nr:FtsW/RodA/SpoVE family cell cycle protein [Candidatus Hydrogenedens sp.]